MEIQVISVKGSKKMKKLANKQFKLLCEDYNRVVKIIDTLEHLLENGEYNKGDVKTFPTAIEAIVTVSYHASLVNEDIEKTVEELVRRLRQADEYKERYIISPLLHIRLEHMANLVVYLREMAKEILVIIEQISSIIERINKIENS